MEWAIAPDASPRHAERGRAARKKVVQLDGLP